MPDRPIVLLGFAATDRSAVGALLARSLGRRFVQLEQVIEEVAGMKVHEIFRRGGEPAFREAEAAALDQALSSSDVVVTVGGAVASRSERLDAMLARGLVVALSRTPTDALAGSSGLSEADRELARELLREGEPFVRRAHLRFDTRGRTPKQLADAVLASLP